MARIVMADDGIVFDGRTKAERPLGGAETAFAELAEALAARGHEVSAYSRCEAELVWQGVTWRPVAGGIPDDADLYIANRSNHLIAACPNAGAAAFWIHNPAGYLLKWRYQWPLLRRRPAIVFLGQDHLGTYPRWAVGGRRLAIPYGISDAFLHAAGRDVAPAPKAIFLSNPQRGLHWLLNLWEERIHRAAPAAELHIFGGAAVYGAAGAAQEGRVAGVLERAATMASQGVVLRGPLDKPGLAAEFTTARALLYRGDIGETFCNAAAETQAMGVPGVVGRIACMAERVRDGETGFVTDTAEQFGEAAILLLTNDKLWLDMSRACLAMQRGRDWNAAAGEWEALLPA